MTKKEIFVSVVVLIVFVGISAGAFAVFKHYHTYKQSVEMVENEKAVINATPPSDAISIKSSAESTDSSGLKVDTTGGSANPGQLGSGQSKSSSTSSSSSAGGSAPGPETFSQYDQYKTAENALFGDIVVGTGAEAAVGKKVTIYYKGWLTNGQLFDQSKVYANGSKEPFSFTVGQRQVIVGMEQDVIGMKVGGKRRMIIPPAVGYGAEAKDTIPANSVLVFDVELVAVE